MSRSVKRDGYRVLLRCLLDIYNEILFLRTKSRGMAEAPIFYNLFARHIIYYTVCM